MTTLDDLYQQQGQSPWLDNLRRDWLQDGRWPTGRPKGSAGVTSNPTIFAKAIAGEDDYDEQFGQLIKTTSVKDAYWELVVDDINAALGLLRPVYDSSDGGDGFISSRWPVAGPRHRRHRGRGPRPPRTDRPAQPLVKIPATAEGVPAIRQMIGEGRSINVTLIFSLKRYGEVIEAYLSGLEGLLARGQTTCPGWPAWPPSSSAGSTPRSTGGIEAAAGPRRRPAVLALRGKAAVAQAKLAYQLFTESSPGPAGRRWRPRGPRCSARCGHRPRPRTRPTPTWSMSTR